MAEYVHNAIIALHNIDSALFHALQNKIRVNSPEEIHIQVIKQKEFHTKLSNSVALNFEYSIY